MPTSRLIIVCGLPGSGKTTASRRLATQTNGIRMSPDEWMAELAIDIWDSSARSRIERLQWKQTQDLLAAGNTVIIEWGTWAREERDALRIRARELGAAVELRFLDAPREVLWQRIQDRGMEHQLGSRAINQEDIDGWFEVFQPPTVEELALYDSPLPLNREI